MALLSVCSFSKACRLVCLLYLFIFCVTWRGVACSVYRAFGLVLLVAFTVLVVFMGDWGGIRLAFTALVVFMGHWR